MQYQVISAGNVAQLQSLVNSEIEKGWSVTGGLAIYLADPREILHPPETVFVQAMIMTDKKGGP
jgi:hypothetical protein